MTQSHKFCGVILAAGQSSRMGREKALLPWPPAERDAAATNGQTLLSASIAALRPATDAVIVVAGKNAAALAPVVAAGGAMLVENPDPDRGQFSSLQTGLREVVRRGYEAVMITPVDCPPLTAGTLMQLCAAFAEATAAGRWAVAPENHGKHGHPLLASRRLIDAFLNAPVTSSAREIKHACEDSIEYVAVDEPLLSVDLNTPEEYAAAVRGQVIP
jgi:molybdenum cofactor cytidylyltransferase